MDKFEIRSMNLFEFRVQDFVLDNVGQAIRRFAKLGPAGAPNNRCRLLSLGRREMLIGKSNNLFKLFIIILDDLLD